jgi:hypothetical protein
LGILEGRGGKGENILIFMFDLIKFLLDWEESACPPLF